MEVPDDPRVFESLHLRLVHPQEDVVVPEAVDDVLLVQPPSSLLFSNDEFIFERRPLLDQLVQPVIPLLAEVPERLQDLARSGAAHQRVPLVFRQHARNLLAYL